MSNSSEISAQDLKSSQAAYNFMIIAMFMAVLDIQIVASSIMHIQASFSASIDEVAWVQTAYLMAEVIMIPMCSWFASTFSTRYFFTVSTLVFTLSSILCAMSSSLTQLIFFRILQGFAGGALIPTVFSSIFTLFDKDQITKQTIKAGLMATVAPTIGPTLGGWITESFIWQWLFLLNIPFGLFVAFHVYKKFRADKPQLHQLKQFDYVGFILLVFSLASLEYILKEGNKVQWFDSNKIIFLTTFCLTCFITLIFYEIRHKHPLIKISAFANRNFTISCFTSFAIGVALYGITYIYPVILSTIRNMSSIEIGIVMFITGASQLFSGPIAGILEKRMDPRLMLGIGFLVFGSGLIINSFMTRDVSFNELLIPQILRGSVVMFCFLPTTKIAFSTLKKSEIADASGLYNLMRNLGGAIGIAFINYFVTVRAKYHEVLTLSNVDEIKSQQMMSMPDLYYNSLNEENFIAIFDIMQKEIMIRSYNDLLFFLGCYLIFCCLLIVAIKKAKN
jgi:DHA2 family multidrug resistance protein